MVLPVLFNLYDLQLIAIPTQTRRKNEKNKIIRLKSKPNQHKILNSIFTKLLLQYCTISVVSDRCIRWIYSIFLDDLGLWGKGRLVYTGGRTTGELSRRQFFLELH